MYVLTWVNWFMLSEHHYFYKEAQSCFPFTFRDFLEHVREYVYLFKMVSRRTLWCCICAWSRFYDLTFYGNTFIYLGSKTFWGVRKYNKYNYLSNIICRYLSCMTYNCVLDITDNGWSKIGKNRKWNTELGYLHIMDSKILDCLLSCQMHHLCTYCKT